MNFVPVLYYEGKDSESVAHDVLSFLLWCWRYETFAVEQKAHEDIPQCSGDCSRALSVSALRVRLGRNRLSGVQVSGAMLGGEWHPIPHILWCQQKICHFHRRFKPIQRTERERMNKFLRHKVVP
jgi:hypothetical protein